jgi:hypothetical protein
VESVVVGDEVEEIVIEGSPEEEKDDVCWPDMVIEDVSVEVMTAVSDFVLLLESVSVIVSVKIDLVLEVSVIDGVADCPVGVSERVCVTSELSEVDPDLPIVIELVVEMLSLSCDSVRCCVTDSESVTVGDSDVDFDSVGGIVSVKVDVTDAVESKLSVTVTDRDSVVVKDSVPVLVTVPRSVHESVFWK